MPKTDTRIAFLQTTDAEFRTWVAAVIADLGTLGLLQTADTGQINTATVTKPGAANTVQGYTMWTLNDGLTNCFIKIEFGSGSTGALCPAMYFTVGWQTDGAGNFISTDNSARLRYRFLNTNAGTTAYLRMCKVGSCFSAAYNEELAGGSANPWGIVIDRYRDAVTGSANATGLMVITVAGTEVNSTTSGAVAFVTIAQPAGATPQEFSGLGLIGPFQWTNTASWSRGSRLGVGTLCAWDAGATQPTIGAVSCTTDDVPRSTTFTLAPYAAGASYIYRALGIATISNTGAIGGFCYIWQT